MTNGEVIQSMFPNMNFGTLAQDDVIVNKDYSSNDEPQVFIPKRVWNAEYKEPNKSEIPTGSTAKNDLGVDCISRADALCVAKNEYLRGWHNALCKALSEKYLIHCEEGNFSVIQEETITGLGLSMNCALGKDAESYMSTIPSVTPQEPKMGHWIYQISDDYLGELNRYYECSECGRTVGDTVGNIYTDYPYCHCGAKMIEPQESEEE